jgi:hypothetical protein
LLLLQAAIVLGGVYVMLNAFGDVLDRRLDEQVNRVENQFRRELRAVQRNVIGQVRRELGAGSGR